MTTYLGLCQTGEYGILASDTAAVLLEVDEEGHTHGTLQKDAAWKLQTPSQNVAFALAGPALNAKYFAVKQGAVTHPVDVKVAQIYNSFARFDPECGEDEYETQLYAELQTGNVESIAQINEIRGENELSTAKFSLCLNGPNGPELYDVQKDGSVEEAQSVLVGSGSPYVAHSLLTEINQWPEERTRVSELVRLAEKTLSYAAENVSLEKAVRLSRGLIDVAGQDIHTDGYDLAVVTPSGARCFREEIRTARKEFEGGLTDLVVQLAADVE